MRDRFEVYGYSIANAGKEKNGDHYVFEFLEHEGLLLAVVADGVSRQPCDWLASQTSCLQTLERFRDSTTQKDISTRLKDAIFPNKRCFDFNGRKV